LGSNNTEGKLIMQLTHESKELPIVNEYGNVEVSGLPTGYVHISGKRLGVTAKAINVSFAPAMVGWTGSRRWRRPLIDGIVVRAGDADTLREALSSRRTLTPEQRQRQRQRKQQRDSDRFASLIREQYPQMPEPDVVECADHATTIGSGRVGRSRTADDPVKAGVVAYARHTYTEYDELVAGEDDLGRQWARDSIRKELTCIIAKWERDNGNTKGEHNET
jgi:hypothetical protein